MKKLMISVVAVWLGGCASIPTGEVFAASSDDVRAEGASIIVYPGSGLPANQSWQVEMEASEKRLLAAGSYQRIVVEPGEHRIAVRPRIIGEDSKILVATAWLVTYGNAPGTMEAWRAMQPVGVARVVIESGKTVYLQLDGSTEAIQLACNEDKSDIHVCTRTRSLLHLREVEPADAKAALTGFRRVCNEDC